MFIPRFFLLVFIAAGATACGDSSPEVANVSVANTGDKNKRAAETVASHTIKEKPELDAGNKAEPAESPSGAKRKWSRSGRPIDTSRFDNAVIDAESALKSRAGDDSAKKALGKAYFERGVALVGAQQYAAAMGDFRKALKQDPANEDARRQLTMIASIYRSINIEAPAEGEEPAPLEFKGQKD